MRRLLLSFAVLSTFALAANAQDVRKFYDEGGCYLIQLDTKNMRVMWDACGKEEWLKVQNYKKSGNKETFSAQRTGYGLDRYEFVKKDENKYVNCTRWI